MLIGYYDQCCRFSQYIGYVTLKIIYFHYLKNYFLAQNIQKTFYVILKTKTLTMIHRAFFLYAKDKRLLG